MSNQTFTLKDNGKQFFLASRTAPFIINLKGNMTTGYSWELKKSDIVSTVSNDEFLTKHFRIERKYNDSNKGTVGGPGMFTFTCTPLQELVNMEFYHMNFVYRRPWEKEDEENDVKFNLKLRA